MSAGSDPAPADEEDPPAPVVVPHTALDPAVLRRLIEGFVLREGTEYGATDVPLQAKVAQVLRQLERGQAQIVYEAKSQSVDIVPVR